MQFILNKYYVILMSVMLKHGLYSAAVSIGWETIKSS